MKSTWEKLKRMFVALTTKDLPSWKLPGAVLAIVVAVIYSNALKGGFIFDDLTSIVNNAYIRSFTDLFIRFKFDQYSRFLTNLSFTIDFQLFALNSFGYHITNILFHIINALLVFAVVRLLFSTPLLIKTEIAKNRVWFSFLTALLFATHPLQTQAVTYIAQRASLLAGMFFLLTVLFYLLYRLSNRLIWLSVMVVTGTCSLFTKENAVSLIGIIPVIELTLFKTSKKTYTLFGVLAAISAVFALLVSNLFNFSYIFGTKLSPLGETLTPWTYFITQFKSLLLYLRLIVLPFGQNLDHYVPMATSLFNGLVLLGILVALGLVVTVFLTRRKAPLVALGIAWFLITPLADSSIVVLEDVFNEHRMYLPLVGVSFVVIWIAFKLLKNKLTAIVAVVAGLSLIYSILTIARNTVWANQITMWSDVIQKSPKKHRAYTNLGAVYAALDQGNEALRYYEQAMRLKPDDGAVYNNISHLFIEHRQYEKALPFALKSVEFLPQNAVAQNNLGIVYANLGEDEKALRQFELAVQLDPNYRKAVNNLKQQQETLERKKQP